MRGRACYRPHVTTVHQSFSATTQQLKCVIKLINTPFLNIFINNYTADLYQIEYLVYSTWYNDNHNVVLTDSSQGQSRRDQPTYSVQTFTQTNVYSLFLYSHSWDGYPTRQEKDQAQKRWHYAQLLVTTPLIHRCMALRRSRDRFLHAYPTNASSYFQAIGWRAVIS